jgi:hypothetical protein
MFVKKSPFSCLLRYRLWACVSLVTLLVACGGGGNNGQVTTTELAELSKSCSLNVSIYKSLFEIEQISSFDQISKAAQCIPNGPPSIEKRFYKFGVYGGDDYRLTWSDPTSGYSFSVVGNTYDDGKTFGSFRIEEFATDIQKPATRCAFKFFDFQLLAVGQTIDQANQILGCNGFAYAYTMDESRQLKANFSWGQGTDTNAFVKTVDGVIKSGYALEDAGFNCAPSYFDWFQIKIGDAVGTVKSKMKCQGRLFDDLDDTNRAIGTFKYSWTNGAGDCCITALDTIASAEFKNGLVFSTQYNPLPLKEYCVVPQQNAERILTGMTRAQVAVILGCEPREQSSSRQTNEMFQTTAVWGNFSFNYIEGVLRLHFVNDSVVTRRFVTGTFAVSKCEAPKNLLDTVLIGDSYATAIQKIGCEGVLTYGISDQTGPVISTYVWKTDSTQKGSTITLKDGFVAEKS